MKKFINYRFNIINTAIVLFFFLSLLYSKYNLINYDKYSYELGHKPYHQMIKTDSYRYMSQGADIKRDLDNGINFFKTGPESYTKYLPSRIAAAYYYFFDLNLFNNFEEKRINIGIHFPYLVIQCLFYYLSLFFLSLSLIKIFNKKIVFFIITFLAIEPTIFQYHGTFWSETYFFSLQIILLALILNKNNNKFHFLFVGIFLAILSLQKQMAIFYVVPVVVFYYFTEKFNKIRKILIVICGFFFIQLILGVNNYERSGKFYLLTADTKLDLHRDLVEIVMSKKSNISRKDFAINEGKVAFKWIKDNSIPYNKSIDYLPNQKFTYMDYRGYVLNESDRVNFDNFIRNRTFQFILENLYEFGLHVLQRSFHTLLLNPFHIYSDHNFRSGEYYYTTITHDKLIPYRIVYSLLIYTFSIVGLFCLFKDKNYKLLFLLFLSASYFYTLVSWHGNTRYFVPVLIYISVFFGNGVNFFLTKFNK